MIDHLQFVLHKSKVYLWVSPRRLSYILRVDVLAHAHDWRFVASNIGSFCVTSGCHVPYLTDIVITDDQSEKYRNLQKVATCNAKWRHSSESGFRV